jgi:hypothetical protein
MRLQNRSTKITLAIAALAAAVALLVACGSGTVIDATSLDAEGKTQEFVDQKLAPCYGTEAAGFEDRKDYYYEYETNEEGKSVQVQKPCSDLFQPVPVAPSSSSEEEVSSSSE